MAYLVVFLLCLLLSLVSTWCVQNLANAKGWIHFPKFERHVHTIPVPRLGGVAIYFSFMAVVILAMAIPQLSGTAAQFHASAMIGLLGPASIVFLLGLFDDIYSLNAYWKFGIETIAAIWLYAAGYGIHNLGFIGGGKLLAWVYCLPLTIIWVLLITNAFNLIDGLDGLAAGSAFFSTLVVFVMSLVVPNPLVALIAITLAGATLGFLRFNFFPASIFLGDSGSLFIGFMLAAMALIGSQKASTMVAVAIPVLSLGLPILDVVLAVVRRFLAAKPLFEGDKHHIHHKLLARGMSQRNAVLTLYVVTAGFGFVSLVLLQQRKSIALVLAALGIAIALGVHQLRYQEFAELLSTFQRATRRRQILRETFEPIGFEAVRLRKLGSNGFSSASLQPFHYAQDGSWLLCWFEHEMAEPPWELRLALNNNKSSRWGYFSLISMSDREPLLLDINVLTEEFRDSLSGALERASIHLEELQKVDDDGGNGKTRAIAAGTMVS